MIDYLILENPLPIPKEYAGVFSLIDISSKTTVTDSISGASFRTFCISDLGDFYIEKYEASEDLKEKFSGIEKKEYTGEIKFSIFHSHVGYDYDFPFVVLFYKGKLQESISEPAKRKDNAKRIESTKRAEEIIFAKLNRANSPLFRALFIVAFPVYVCVLLVRYSFAYLDYLLSKIQKALTFR